MKLQASKAYTWAKKDGCTGYTRLYHTIRPETERDMSAANEGIEAHNIAAEVLRVPTRDGEGEMWEYAHQYADIVYRDVGKDSCLIIEEKMVTSFAPDITPIVDCASYDNLTKVLRVYEYKYGTAPVEVEENPQLMLGVNAILKKYMWEPEKIELYVFQPRAFHRDGPLRMWECTYDHLDQFIHVARLRYDEEPTCRSGNHCAKCPIMLKCEAHTNSIMSCVDFVESPEEWYRDPESIGAEYRLLKRIYKTLEKRVEALKVEVEHLTEEGHNTGFILGEKTQPLQWFRPVKEMVEIAKALGIDIIKEPSIITPKQAMDKKILSEKDILNFAGRPSPAKVLKPLDGKLLKELK